MWYAFICEDVENSLSKRKKVRADHLKRVEVLKNQGRILIAGPTPKIDCEDPGIAGFSGSLIVAEFENIEEAELWIKDDPYNLHGVFKSVKTKPFKLIFP